MNNEKYLTLIDIGKNMSNFYQAFACYMKQNNDSVIVNYKHWYYSAGQKFQTFK